MTPKAPQFPDKAEACGMLYAERWRKRGKYEGCLCHTPSPHYSGLTFTVPVLVMRKEKKYLKIPAHLYREPAQRNNVAPTEAHKLHISHNAVE